MWEECKKVSDDGTDSSDQSTLRDAYYPHYYVLRPVTRQCHCNTNNNGALLSWDRYGCSAFRAMWATSWVSPSAGIRLRHVGT